MSDLHDRIASALGWTPAEARSLSMHSLRDLVRPVNPELAQEISHVIQSGAYIVGAPAPTMKPSTKIWRRGDWSAPGTSKPSKTSWTYVRDVRGDEVDEWLRIFRRDEPGVVFIASPTKPRGKKGPKILKGPGFTY